MGEKMSIPVVSIIMPVYQVSEYVERCLTSVLRQSFTDMECIIVDDATKDDSIAKCENLIDKYNGPISFKILHHSQNRGLSAARNTGTMSSTGEWLYYLDSDDEITPDCITQLLGSALDNPDAEMVIGKHLIISETQVMDPDKDPLPILRTNEIVFSHLYQKLIPFAVWNKLIKRSFIEKHNLYFKEGIIAEDLLWMFYVAKYLSVVSMFKEVTYHYYIRQGSITTSGADEAKARSFFIVYDDIIHHLTPGREGLELDRYVEGLCYFYLHFKAKNPEYKDLFKIYKEAAKKFRNKRALIILNITGILGLFGDPSGLLKVLQGMRQRVNRTAGKIPITL